MTTSQLFCSIKRARKEELRTPPKVTLLFHLAHTNWKKIPNCAKLNSAIQVLPVRKEDSC